MWDIECKIMHTYINDPVMPDLFQQKRSIFFWWGVNLPYRELCVFNTLNVDLNIFKIYSLTKIK